MSKKIILADKQEYEVSDSSSITALEISVSSFADIDNIYKEITIDNFIGATLDGNLVSDIVPVDIKASKNTDSDTIIVNITNRTKSHEELMDEQIKELQDAVIGGQIQ